MNDLIVVGLDIPKDHPSFKEYHLSDYRKQVDIICDRILQACAKLKTKHPDATWLFTWRECGITNGDDLYLSHVAKKYFKQRLLEISASNENIAIVAGPLPTIKTTTNAREISQRLQQAKKYFAKTENDLGHDPSRMFSEKVEDLIEYPPKNLRVIRETLYVFQHGQCTHRHDKQVPDIGDITQSSYPTIFKTGNKKNNSSLININGHKVSVEICKEHKYGVAKHEAERELTSMDLQLILSEGSSVSRKNICAKHVFQADESFEMQLIDAQPDVKSKMLFYRQNIFEPIDLSNPLEPVSINQATNVKPPLFEALLSKDEETIYDLLPTLSTDLINQTWSGLSPIEIVISTGLHPEILSKLIENGADVNKKNANGATPLHIAILQNNPDAVKILLDKGANINETFNHKSPLSLAFNVKDSDEVRGLIISAKASSTTVSSDTKSNRM